MTKNIATLDNLPCLSTSDIHLFEQAILEILQKLPPPRWGIPRPQKHLRTSCSKFASCPALIKEDQDQFPLVRGTAFHQHYIPPIFAEIGVTAELEGFVSTNIPCRECPTGSFEFGGSFDVYLPRFAELWDFKFTSSTSFKPSAYSSQVNSYRILKARASPVRKQRIVEVKVSKDDGHPVYVKFHSPRFIEWRDLERLALEFHGSVDHGHTLFRPNSNCWFCSKRGSCPARMPQFVEPDAGSGLSSLLIKSIESIESAEQQQKTR